MYRIQSCVWIVIKNTGIDGKAREIVQNKKRLRKEFWKTSKFKGLLERERNPEKM